MILSWDGWLGREREKLETELMDDRRVTRQVF